MIDSNTVKIILATASTGYVAVSMGSGTSGTSGTAGTSGADGTGAPAGGNSRIQFHATSGFGGTGDFVIVTGSPTVATLTGRLDATNINISGNKAATEDDAIMGSIKSSTGDGTFAQVDFKGEGNTASQTGSMVFTTYEGGVAKQVMDLSATNANTVTIGTGSNSANLKVFGTLTAASTAYENDLLPAVDGGGVNEAGLGASDYRWKDL